MTPEEENERDSKGCAAAIGLSLACGGIFIGLDTVAGPGWGCLGVGVAVLLLMLAETCTENTKKEA